jgi:transcriptional regulator with XRE-family HTH domain
MEDDLLSPEEIERRVAAIGGSLREICARAGIAHTTFYRWRSAETQPTLDVYRRIRDALRSMEGAA